MVKFEHFFSYYNRIFPEYWDKHALTDYNGETDYTFGGLAEKITKLGIMFEQLGVKPGDKIALCGRNCANWAASYLAIAAYGGVIVSILHEFKGDDIQKLVKHSDSKLLLIGPYMWKSLNPDNMPEVEAIVSLDDFSVLQSERGCYGIDDEVESEFARRYPNGFGKEDFHLRTGNLDDLLLINYTSGSTGSPKGVMLTYRSLSSNVYAGLTELPNKPGWTVVSMLPLAHMYGQLAEFLYPLANACHIYFLTKSPTPSLLMKAFADVHPYIIVTVPLVIEKIYKRSIYPAISKPSVRRMLKVPVLRGIIKRVVLRKLMYSFGNRLKYFIVGGAALNEEVERCLLDMRFPLIVGYGMTECGPLIGGTPVDKYVFRSAGRVLPFNELKIDSEDPLNVVGEILVRGYNVMKGYYKNEEGTRAVFTEDGWMRTGDLGVLDKGGNIFIKGRNKSMILGSSGQNIYPEEIEDKLNNMDGVIESVVVEREGKLIGLVFPDYDKDRSLEFDGLTISEMMKRNLQKLNDLLPKYSQISRIELMKCEFEKTPKRSIKRFLYS